MSAGTNYVQQRDGNWYVAESRVEVYSVIAAWLQGYSPEEVQSSFPVLSRAEVYGTILFYLEHQDELDAFFREVDALGEQLRAEAEAQHADFYADMRARIARHQATNPPTAAAS